MVPELASLYARAVGPLAAATIATDSQGLETASVSLPSDDATIPAYLAHPAARSRSPLLLVVQEIFGVHEHIRDVCRRLAKQGYFAIAPELYVRQGRVADISDMQEIIDRVVRNVPDAQVLRDLDATVAFAAATGKADVDRLGIVGFCWGGRIVWLYSAHRPDLQAGAAWYGKLAAGPYSTPAMQPKQPLDVAGELHGAILGLYGGRDTGIPLTDVSQMRAALSSAGKARECEIVVYPDAGHAFNADYRPGYHEASAKDAWSKMLSWFEKHRLSPPH